MFFSDDGSTAVEVALKMAFRKYMVDQGLTEAVAGDRAVTLEVSSKGRDLRFVCGGAIGRQAMSVVALIMAFRKYLVDHGLTEAVVGNKPVSLEVSRPCCVTSSFLCTTCIGC